MYTHSNGWGSQFAALDELQRHMAGIWGTLPAATVARESATISDQGDAYVLEADVPGAGPDDVKLDVTSKGFTLGVQTKGEDHGELAARRLERAEMSFSRKVELPLPIDPEKVSASLENGVLRIVFAKAAEAAPRRIAVNAGGATTVSAETSAES